jgi:hypothetical protein
MLAKQPADRFATPAELAAALAPFAVGALEAPMSNALSVDQPAQPLAVHGRPTSSASWIVVGTTLAGLALIQATPPQYPDELIRLFQTRPPATIPRFLLWIVGSLPIVVMWMLALLALRSRRPDADPRRVVFEPGMAACGMAALGMAVAVLLIFLVLTIPGNWQGLSSLVLRLVPLTCYMSAVPVVAAWAGLAATGRWRPVPSFIDRLGRALGAWLVLVVLLTSGGVLFGMTAALSVLFVIAWTFRRFPSGRAGGKLPPIGSAASPNVCIDTEHRVP